MQDQSSSGEPPNIAFDAEGLGLQWPSPGPPQLAMPRVDDLPADGGTPSVNRVCDKCIQ